jgi:hypothetical protein
MVNSQELIENPKSLKPHVVLLGAGASKAGFPKGDASGNQLPVMNDLVDKIGLSSLLKNSGVDFSRNFESIYSQLIDKDLKNEIEKRIVDYFSNLYLPETVTIYDQLLLSLRGKDAIFTFNWDPFLFDAYQRNQDIAPLPHIYFLHGNVRIGACESCDNWGMKFMLCPMCNIKFKDVPLLYPIEKKRYFETSRYTAMSWKSAMCWFSEAFTVTIFGYSAPTSDQEAVELLKKGWFQNSERKFEHVEVIDILCADQLYEKWKEFTPTQHLSSEKTFKKSLLWRWPRRSCEAQFYPMSQGLPCDDFPIPTTNNLTELHSIIKKIACFETSMD